MQLSAITLFIAAAFADDSAQENTATITSYVTKVVSQHTTYVPMAVTFLDHVKNVTYYNGTESGNSTAAATSSAHNSSSSSAAASSSAAEANGAARVAGLSVALAGAALLL